MTINSTFNTQTFILADRSAVLMLTLVEFGSSRETGMMLTRQDENQIDHGNPSGHRTDALW